MTKPIDQAQFRHARVFELIRQKNQAECARVCTGTRPRLIVSDLDIERLRDLAVRSLSHAPTLSQERI